MLPNLFLAGFPKAGTTSLFSWLAAHPEVCGARPKEPGHFLPLRWGDPLPPPDYARNFAHARSERWRLDGTPGHAYGGGAVAEAIREASPDAHAILLLRDPVGRAFSYYRYRQSQGRLTGVDFGDYVERCLALPEAELGRRENQDLFGVAGGCYARWLPEWQAAFGDALRVEFFDTLVADPAALLASICDWLGLDGGEIPRSQTGAENVSLLYRSRAVQRLAIAVDHGFAPLWRWAPWSKRLLSGAHRLLNAKPHPAVLDDASRRRLEEYYAPHNRALAQQLSDRELPGWLT